MVLASCVGIERATEEPSQLVYIIITYSICISIMGWGLWWVERKRFMNKKSSNTVLDELLNGENDAKNFDIATNNNLTESIERDSNGDLVVGDIMAMALGGFGNDEDIIDEDDGADLMAGLIVNSTD